MMHIVWSHFVQSRWSITVPALVISHCHVLSLAKHESCVFAPYEAHSNAASVFTLARTGVHIVHVARHGTLYIRTQQKYRL